MAKYLLDAYIVIPAYNEKKTIGKVLESLENVKLSIIVVDDGSKDNSKLKVKNLKLKNLTLLEHKVNLGKGAAMKTGAEAAFEMGADAVIFMDADGQHVAGDIFKFVKVLNDGYDMVLGSRNTNYGVPLVRYLGNKFGAVLISLLFGIYVSDLLCGYRAMTKKAYERIKWESMGYGVETEMVVNLAKSGLRWCEVPVTVVYNDRYKGVSLFDSFGILFDIIKWRLSK